MKRKRFELLLRIFYCSNSALRPPSNRLFKVEKLPNLLVAKHKMVRSPIQLICIDKSIILFVGHLLFRQYI